MFYNVTDSEESIIRRAIPQTASNYPTARTKNKNTLATQSTTAPPPDRDCAQNSFHFDTSQVDTYDGPPSSAPPFPYIRAPKSLASSPSRLSLAARSAPPHQRFHCYKVVNNYYIGDQKHTRIRPGRHVPVAAQSPIRQQGIALNDFDEAEFRADYDDDLSCTERTDFSMTHRPASTLHGLDFSRPGATRQRPEQRGLHAGILATRDTLPTDLALLQAMGHRSTQLSSKRSLSVRRAGELAEGDYERDRRYAFMPF